MKGLILILTACLAFCGAGMAAADFDHSGWDRLLTRHVSPTDDGASTVVDYSSLRVERQALQNYLAQLTGVDKAEFDSWARAQRLSFLINAYNAWTVELILREYPEIDSIKDIGGWFGSPWKQAIAPLLGSQRTLDEIEHDMVRGSGQFDEPRIHFAVNCASVGCPALRPEAYVAGKLESQLEAQTRAFLGDRSRNAWRDNALHLSPLFKWYREDFETGWRGADSLFTFIALYADALNLSPSQKEALLDGDVPITYTDYDWTLNDLRDE